jgi:hypothetical protein
LCDNRHCSVTNRKKAGLAPKPIAALGSSRFYAEHYWRVARSTHSRDIH